MRKLLFLLLSFFVCHTTLLSAADGLAEHKNIAYLLSDGKIPFWDIMARGVVNKSKEYGYNITLYSADNDPKKELQNLAKALKSGVDGVVISPTSSLACATLLKIANKAKVPVVIADIGSDGGEYLSFVASNNKEGAYGLGKILAKAMKRSGGASGRVGIIAIPQKRRNGQERTAGFMQAMQESGIAGGEIKQQVDFSHQETYDFTLELIAKYPDLRAIWLQGSNRYQAALDAIKSAHKEKQILLACFDAEPIFLELIPKGVIVGAAMQQPYLIGEKSVEQLYRHFTKQPVIKNIPLSILVVSKENIAQKLPIIERNVLGVAR